jgi:hypothetical protein
MPCRQALGVKSAIPHPRIMGIIRECGGKMNMHDQLWSEAATDFFEVRGCVLLAAAGRMPRHGSSCMHEEVPCLMIGCCG